MKEYAKVVLYAYPILKRIGEEYQIHISNSALLSYKSKKSAEELVEYLAKEIIYKQRLEWLAHFLEGIMDKLDETEKALLQVRYFSPCKSRKSGGEGEGQGAVFQKIAAWTDSTYYRRQARLSEKIETLFTSGGLSEEIFEQDFAFIDILASVARFVQRGGDEPLRKRERRQVSSSVS